MSRSRVMVGLWLKKGRLEYLKSHWNGPKLTRFSRKMLPEQFFFKPKSNNMRRTTIEWTHFRFFLRFSNIRKVLNVRFCSLYLLSELKFLDNFYVLFKEIRSFRKNSESILFPIFQFILNQYFRQCFPSVLWLN